MRQIILDTETTGLDPGLGHRIIELAAVEMVNRRPTGNHYHRYLNPERDSDAGALQVHGLTSEFLQDKPKFSEIVEEFLSFITSGELIIHNAAFDVAFLNAELGKIGRGVIREYCLTITDTLRIAKDLHPGKRNNLDALCERYGIDNAARTVHGALLDAQLLGEVYLAMTRGQESLAIDVSEIEVAATLDDHSVNVGALLVVHPSEAELTAHRALLQDVKKASKGICLWEQQE